MLISPLLINKILISILQLLQIGDVKKMLKKTAQNIQIKNPEIVIAAGDLSYDESSDCWFEIIQPFKSKMKIAMGDHEYSDTSGGAIGIINEYLKPLNLTKNILFF